MTFDAKETGMRIRRQREQLGIDLTKAALDLHLSREHLRRIETGNRAPSLDLVIELASYLRTSTDHLLTGKLHAKSSVHNELQKVIVQLESLCEKL